MLKRFSPKKWILASLGVMRRHWLRTVALAMMVLTLGTSLLVGNEPAYARDVGAGLEVSNTYALVVSTGASAGQQVEFFGITYIDHNGTTRTQYVFTRKGKYFSGDGQFSYQTMQQKVPNGNFYEQRKAELKSNQGYDLINKNSGENTLRANTTDTILFEPTMPIKAITGISFFGAQNGVLIGQWSCRAMRIYKVNKLFGYSAVGYFSNQRYAEFQGTMLAKAKIAGEQTFTWSQDKMFQGGRDTYTIETNFTPDEADYDSTKQPEYFFEIAFDDTYGAGIETLINTSSSNTLLNMDVYNALSLEVQYVDIYNVIQKVTMPVIPNSINWALKNGMNRGDIINGIAQQGESIGFAGVLPDCKFVQQYRIAYGYSKARWESGIEAISASSLHKQRVEQQSNPMKPDSVLVSHFAIYDMSKTNITAKLADGRLQLEKKGDPFRTAARVRGLIQPDSALEVQLEDFAPARKLETNDYHNTYLITLKTDDMPSAGTLANLLIRFQYTDIHGNNQSTSQYLLKEAYRDYYGQTDLAGADPLYAQLLSPGQEIKFMVTLKDVGRFTGFSIAMDKGVNDDWQMKSLAIEKISVLGKRTISMTSWSIKDANNNSVSGDRFTSRENICIPLASSEDPIMLQPDNEFTTSLDGSTLVPGEDMDEEWSDQRYQMSYEQAIKDMGMTKARQTYSVTVNVADDQVTSTSNGDCGSRNHFYFQLVFKNGASAYVLANQQLSADGFRPGVAEQFSISVNQNYGEVISINIIPDGVTSENQMYDKLKINSIEISRAGTGGVSKQWVINDIGWVAIDYREEGESQKTGLSTPRTEKDLSRSYTVDYTTFLVNLQFCISTGEYKKDENTGIKPPQFVGSMKATVGYYNGAGEYKTISFDVVNAMYLYAQKAPNFVGPDENGLKLLGDNSVSDPTYMFRENHSDRFVVGINDISELSSISVQVAGVNATVLPVKSITASMIDSDGPLMLNTDNEYQRRNVTTPVASTVENAGTHMMMVLVGQQSTNALRFGENKITITAKEGDTWESTVDRVPASTNDTLNVFLMPKGEGLTNNNYSISCSIQYGTTFGSTYQSSLQTMMVGERTPMRYATGIAATNMTNPKMLDLSVDTKGKGTIDNFLDYAVVQQVRSGVVIQTHYIQMGATSSSVRQSYKIEGNNGMPPQSQVVELKLGQAMTNAHLTEEGHDFMVSIGYTSQLMQNDTILQSPNIFLTDQQYKSLAAGNTVRIKFDQSFVRDIVSLSLRGTGGVDIPVESAHASVHTVEGGAPTTCTSWTNFPVVGRVNRDGITVTGTPALDGDQVLRTLELTFADEAGKRTETSIPKNPVRMVVNYMNTAGEIVEMTFDDLRTHQVSKAQSDDNTQPLKVAVMLPGVEKLRTVYFEPYDADEANLATWNVPWVYSTLTGPNAAVQRDYNINMPLSEGERTYLNVANLSLSVSGKTYDLTTSSFTQLRASSGDAQPKIDLLTQSGQTVQLLAEAANSQSVFVTKVERVVGASTAAADELLQKDHGNMTFNTPTNESDVNAIYRVSISLTEVPQLTVVVSITVLPEPKKPPVPEVETPEIETPGVETPGVETPKDETKPDEVPAPTPPQGSGGADAGEQNQPPTGNDQSTP